MNPEITKRLLILAATTITILVVTAMRPGWTKATGQIVPAPSTPLLIEVVAPDLWLHVTAWSDPKGRFLLFMTRRGKEHALSIERPGCEPHIARGVRFTAQAATQLILPPCPTDTPPPDPARRAAPSGPPPL